MSTTDDAEDDNPEKIADVIERMLKGEYNAPPRRWEHRTPRTEMVDSKGMTGVVIREAGTSTNDGKWLYSETVVEARL